MKVFFENESAGLNEVRMSNFVIHPNAMKIIQHFSVGKHFYIAMPLYWSDISKQTQKDNIISLWDKKVTVKLYFQLISALNEAHSCGIFHRDSTGGNCLITDNFDLVLGDFGISKDRNLAFKKNTNIGTKFYMSPELLEIT